MICLSIISLFIFILCLSLKEYNNNEVLKDSNSLKNYNINTISMMYETEANSGIYEANKNTLWPSDGYIFNATLSKCENGSELSWDESAKKVIMSGSVSDKCYVYFDVIPSNLFAQYIKQQYNGGLNGLYYHNSSLTNGANDNSYRYSGPNPNNYLCFGSDEETCSANNLYRIIGVFGNNVKVIKNSSIGTYLWNENGADNTWSNASINKKILNQEFLNTFNDNWQAKILNARWSVGGANYGNDSTAKEFFDDETSFAAESYNKIGLAYVSDYGYTLSPTYWTAQLKGQLKNDTNWFLNNTSQWFITRFSTDTYRAIYIASDGIIDYYGTVNSYTSGIRPSFYLEANVTYISGTGTQTNPIRIS